MSRPMRRWPCGALVNNHDGIETWSRLLCSVSFSENTAQLRRVSQLLVTNEVKGLDALPYMEHPRHWVGAELLLGDDARLLHNLCARKRQRSRSREAKCGCCVVRFVLRFCSFCMKGNKRTGSRRCASRGQSAKRRPDAGHLPRWQACSCPSVRQQKWRCGWSARGMTPFWGLVVSHCLLSGAG